MLHDRFFLALGAVLWGSLSVLARAAPTVSNIRCAQVAGTKRVEVRYDVRAAGVTAVKVKLELSANAGSSYAVPVATLSGAVGLGVPVGLDRLVVWEAGQEWNQQVSAQMRVRITADDAPPTAAESGMVAVPGGFFLMGDAKDELIDAPQHEVTLSPYLLGRTEVSKTQWDAVAAWALTRGYIFSQMPRAPGLDYPVQGVEWMDAVVWCNARSEKEGLKPVYFRQGTPGAPLRSVQIGPNDVIADWTANGYRLPTEAEWEGAARGGLTGRRFYRGDRQYVTEANYLSASSSQYEFVPAGYVRPFQGLAPVGSFEPTAYGLSDMMGNVREWVWDWWSPPPGYSTEAVSNPRGAPVGTRRVLRGGDYSRTVLTLRLALRDFITNQEWQEWNTVGFRPARNAP